MKKFLTILWIIIIAGAIFISIQLFKPDSAEKDFETTSTPQVITKQEALDLESEESSKTYTEYLKDGDNYLANNEIDKAISNYKAAAKLNINSAIPLAKLGEAFLLKNDPSSAEKAFKKALELDPASTEIKINITKSYLNAKNIEAAKAQIWQLNQEDYLVQYYKGIILILYKDFEGAKQIFEKLSAQNAAPQPQIPKNIMENSQKFISAYNTFAYFKEGDPLYIQTLLAKTLTEVSEYDAAIRLLYDVINKKNNYRDAWLILGYAYLNTNKILDAVDAFSQAKALDETKPETLFFLGLAYFANDEIDKAIYYIEEADKNGFEPKEQIDLKLGDLYTIKEEYNKAAQKYEKILSSNTENLEIFTRAVWLNIDKINNPQKAMNLSYQAIKAHPENAMGYNLAGWALTALNNIQEAKKYLAKALEINPKLDAAILNLGWLYEKIGSTAIAKEYYKKAYILGKGNSVSNLAASRFNAVTEKEIKNRYLQVNITNP